MKENPDRKKKATEAVVQTCFVKTVFFKTLQTSQENTCARVSILIKSLFFVKKETLAQVLSCEFCKISENTFSNRTPPVAASEAINFKIGGTS